MNNKTSADLFSNTKNYIIKILLLTWFLWQINNEVTKQFLCDSITEVVFY